MRLDKHQHERSNTMPPVANKKGPTEDLATIAKRIKDRERKSHQDQLAHVRAQGHDLISAKAKCKHGEGKKWVEEEAGLSVRQAQKYMDAIKSAFKAHLTEEQQWDEWQRVSGNKPKGGKPRTGKEATHEGYTIRVPLAEDQAFKDHVAELQKAYGTDNAYETIHKAITHELE